MTTKRSIFKAFLIVILFNLLVDVFPLSAQVDCTISIDTPVPVCPDSYFELSVFEGPNQVFDWQRQQGSEFVSVGNESILGLMLQDSATFKILIRDTLTNEPCESLPFGIGVHPIIHIEFIQDKLTCTDGDNDNGKNAQVTATASGAFQPDAYHYFWDVFPIQINPEDSATAFGLKAHQNYSIEVRDNFGCRALDTFYTQAYPNPVIEILAEPSDTAVYLQNPYVTYSFTNLSIDSIPLSSHFWEIIEGDTLFESDLEAPTYKYNSVGEFITYLTVVNQDGCDTTYSTSVEVKPVELFIPNVFTPGDGTSNEKFVITDVDQEIVDEALSHFYVTSHLTVFNRMGRTVFEAENYNNEWDGDNLPDGVYYYVLECHGAKSTDVFKGSVTIIRSN